MNTFIIIVLYDFDKLLSMQLFVYSFRPVKNMRPLADNKSFPVKKKQANEFNLHWPNHIL